MYQYHNPRLTRSSSGRLRLGAIRDVVTQPWQRQSRDPPFTPYKPLYDEEPVSRQRTSSSTRPTVRFVEDFGGRDFSLDRKASFDRDIDLDKEVDLDREASLEDRNVNFQRDSEFEKNVNLQKAVC